MNTQTAATETSPAQPSIVRLQSFKIGDGPSDSALHVDGVAYGQYVSPRNPGPNPNAVHPWERCGLGVAPLPLCGLRGRHLSGVPRRPRPAGFEL